MQKRLTEALIMVLAGWYSPLWAQTQPTESTNALPSETPQQVLISAQKREEKLQSSALSVSALSAAQLQQAGVQTVADLARLSPGLNVVSSGPGQNILIMRGISSTAGSAGTVGYYLDNTPIAASSNASLLSLRGVLDPALLDIARVEVLRGPQGSLYGSSSMGGTVRYLSQSPDARRSSWDYQQQLSHTDGGGWNSQVSAVANFPLVENRLALRLGAFYRWQDGYIQRYPIDAQNYLRLPAAPAESKVNTEKTTGIKAHLKWWLDDGWTINASALQQRTVLGAPFQVDMPPGGIDHLWQTRLVAEPSTQLSNLANLEIRKQFEHFEVISSTSYY